MSVQGVSGDDLATANGVGEQTLGGTDLGGGQGVGVVVTQEGDTNGLGVPVGGVGTHHVPAATLVHVAITADQEVVANIGPAQRVHVVALNVLQLGDAGGLGGAVVTSGVVDHSVAQVASQRGLAGGRATAPLRLGDDGHAEDGLGAEEHSEDDEYFVSHVADRLLCGFCSLSAPFIPAIRSYRFQAMHSGPVVCFHMIEGGYLGKILIWR